MSTKKGLPLWLDRADRISFQPVSSDLDVDVAIIGAGMVGLHCAWLLRDSGLRVAVLESRKVGRQATGRSTAKITSQHGLKYASLIRDVGQEQAQLYADANQRAVAEIADLSSEMPHMASIEDRSAFIYAEDEQQAEQIRQETEAAVSLGLPAEFVADPGLPFPTMGAMRFEGQYQFDPYLYLCGLASLVAERSNGRISVFENSRAVEIEHGTTCRLRANGCTVSASTVVVSTHMPVVNEGLFFAKAFPFAHPVLAAPMTAGARLDGMFISAGNPSHSIRTAGKNGGTEIIIAGGEYKPGEESAQDSVVRDLLDFARSAFGISEPSHLWTNEDFRPMDGLAFIGPAASSHPNLLVATGFQAWGITQGAIAGEILAHRIMGKDHPCTELYDATRIRPISGGPTFVKENLKAAGNLVGSRVLGLGMSDLDEIAPGEGGVISEGGERLAVLKLEDGTVVARSAVCTHMGCVVGWNPVDRTWDCSCHGSRFDEHGEVLEGPAASPLEARPASAAGAAKA